MMAPEVSVIVPTHERRGLLALTLRTVLWQQEVDLELIVVDDGSTDGTAEAVAGLGDRRIRVVRHDTPLGVSTARNDGIDVARGRWVAFLDDDDLWAPNKLAAQLAGVARSGAIWSYTGDVKIDDQDRIIGGRPPPSPSEVMATLPSWNLVPGGCSSVMADRSTVVSIGGFDRQLVNLADWDLWIRLGRKGRPDHVAEPLVAYRLHQGQSSSDVGLILKEAARMDRRYGVQMDRGPFHHYLAHRCLYAGRRRPALKHFAYAAMLGELWPVSMHLWSIARFRLAKRLPLRPPRDPYVPWKSRGRRWLDQLAEQVDRPTSSAP
jgi:glycosyltransferase involved in cell wall biosynthesis